MRIPDFIRKYARRLEDLQGYIMPQYSDSAIQSTCEDASTCKKYAIQKGYWKDSFIAHMVHGIIQRKQPEISRGYYARTESIWQLLCNFIRTMQQNCQIVSLGAGLDTTYWRLHEADLLPQHYIEVDFPDVVNRKIHSISSKPFLHARLEDFSVQQDPSCLHCGAYHLISADLRDLPVFEASLKKCQINFNLPTLFLAECVLIYMTPENSQAIIKWVPTKFKDAVFIDYEQLHMDDSFGQVMIENLKARQCLLAGASVCTSIATQEERFLQCGWNQIHCRDMWAVYNSLPDRKRIERIEMLDESELLQQLMEHYCLIVAVKLSSDLDLNILLR